jgi:hypothetical protein
MSREYQNVGEGFQAAIKFICLILTDGGKQLIKSMQ